MFPFPFLYHSFFTQWGIKTVSAINSLTNIDIYFPLIFPNKQYINIFQFDYETWSRYNLDSSNNRVDIGSASTTKYTDKIIASTSKTSGDGNIRYIAIGA